MRANTAAGLTLIELLVGLSMLALLSVMSWRGLDGMLRSQERLRERGQALASLQTALAQWTLDLDRAAESPYLNALAWDGLQLRIVRRAADDEALVVVAWGLRPAGLNDGVNVGFNAGSTQATGTLVWRRWQSVPVRDRAALLKAWGEAVQGLDDANAAVTLVSAETWALQMHQGADWARPPLVGPGSPLLEPATAVRLRLQLPASSGLQGALQLDWANPRQNRGRQ
jgi:general secretion pathway protein J